MGSTVIVNNGQPLYFTDHGGSGPAVVLLHSFLMDEQMFASQVTALSPDFRLVTVDARGHGGTPADGPFDYWDVPATYSPCSTISTSDGPPSGAPARVASPASAWRSWRRSV